jgi:hypothetical protein
MQGLPGDFHTREAKLSQSGPAQCATLIAPYVLLAILT